MNSAATNVDKFENGRKIKIFGLFLVSSAKIYQILIENRFWSAKIVIFVEVSDAISAANAVAQQQANNTEMLNGWRKKIAKIFGWAARCETKFM